MKQIIEGLIRLADHLDKKGLAQEADLTDSVLKLIKANQPEAEPVEEESMMEKDGDQPADEEACEVEEADEEKMMPMKAMEEKAVLRRKARREKLLAKLG